jgi:hypothetical protein
MAVDIALILSEEVGDDGVKVPGKDLGSEVGDEPTPKAAPNRGPTGAGAIGADAGLGQVLGVWLDIAEFAGELREDGFRQGEWSGGGFGRGSGLGTGDEFQRRPVEPGCGLAGLSGRVGIGRV